MTTNLTGVTCGAIVLGLASLGLSASVNAALYDANLAPTSAYTITSFPYDNISGDPGSGAVSGSFGDFYDFTIIGNNEVASNAVKLDLELGGEKIFHISNLHADLWEDNAGTWVWKSSAFSFDNILADDNYRIVVSGDADGSSGGLYSLAVSAVPIPAAVWLLGSGLIGIAAIARRKTPDTAEGETLPA